MQQLGFKQYAAAFQCLCQALGGAQLTAVGEGAEQFVDAATQGVVPGAEVLQAFEQAFQRRLAVLLRGQLLAQYQLVQAAAQRQEGQILAALYLGAEQAAEGQFQRAVQGQLAASQWCVEQVHQQAIDRLGVLRRQRVAADDLALHQRAQGQLLQVQAGQRFVAAGLQRQGQAGVRQRRHQQRAALRQWPWAFRLQGGLLAAIERQLEQQLEALRLFTDGDHLGLGAFACGQHALQRLQQTHGQVSGRHRAANYRWRGGKRTWAADFAHLGSWSKVC